MKVPNFILFPPAHDIRRGVARQFGSAADGSTRKAVALQTVDEKQLPARFVPP
jgi:hypothetical protein